nr:hypothetical protein [Thermoleophilaceae bacterium]
MRTRRGLAGVAALLVGVAAVLVVLLNGVLGGDEPVEVGAATEATAPPASEPASRDEDGPKLVAEPPVSEPEAGTGQRDGAGPRGAGAL